jgi:hypothetical protein
MANILQSQGPVKRFGDLTADDDVALVLLGLASWRLRVAITRPGGA